MFSAHLLDMRHGPFLRSIAYPMTSFTVTGLSGRAVGLAAPPGCILLMLAISADWARAQAVERSKSRRPLSPSGACQRQ